MERKWYDPCKSCGNVGSTLCPGKFNSECPQYIFDREQAIQNHFQPIINEIGNQTVRKIVLEALRGCPAYIFVVAASSTGKYHPPFSLGKEGLIRHIKAAVIIALKLLEHPYYRDFTEFDRDIIIGALLIHDLVKSGFDYSVNVWTVNDHPLLVEELIDSSNFTTDEERTTLNTLLSAVRGHMGPWTNGVCPEPVTRVERFVHHCDYISSRKIFLDFDFR